MQLGNMIGMGMRTVGYRFLGRRCPVNVMMAVTNRCNARCSYCKIPTRTGREMTTTEICGLIDQMKAAGAIRLGLWGGEPLVREDIGQVVDHAKGKGLYVTMDSNGLLWPERGKELQNLDHVVFALDGRKENHEANRGEGTFDKVMDALEQGVVTPGLTVWTLTVLTRNNLKDIDFILDTAKRLNTYAAFQVLHHNNVLGRNHDKMMASNEEYKDAIALILARKKEGARVSSSSRYLSYLQDWVDYGVHTRPEPHRGLRCKAGGLYCNVDADGKVYACSLMVGEAEARSALEVGFKAAFDAIPPIPCQACTAACFTEYNYLYNLDPVCIAEWIKTTRG